MLIGAEIKDFSFALSTVIVGANILLSYRDKLLDLYHTYLCHTTDGVILYCRVCPDHPDQGP